MSIKPRLFAQLEAVQYWLRKDPTMQATWEYHSNVATTPDGRRIDLPSEFPRLGWRTSGDKGEPLDEMWIANSMIGAAMAGGRGLARQISMCTFYGIEAIFNVAAFQRYATGGKGPMRYTCWFDMAGRGVGGGAIHATSGQESAYANMPGIIVVVPGTAYDAKGLLNAALAGDDPVCYFDYTGLAALPPEDIPDDPYIVPIGKAAVRQEGKDLTLAYWGEATLQVVKALPELAKAGISVEAIDVRTLKPYDRDTLARSVTKTKRLLVMTTGHFTNDFASHVVACAAVDVPGAKFYIMSFPDAPAPAAREMILWMTPNAAGIVERAKKLVG